MRNKSSTVASYDLATLLAEVQQKLQRDLPLTPRHVLCGAAADVQEDTYHMSWTRDHLKFVDLCHRPHVHPQFLLNGSEQRRLRDYIAAWRPSAATYCAWEDLICHLGDDPANGWYTWSARSNMLPTIRRSSGIFWSCAEGRQVLLKEMYAAMGFAAFDHLARVSGIAKFQVWRPTLTYRHMLQALGNSQHVANVGVFAVCALACASAV